MPTPNFCACGSGMAPQSARCRACDAAARLERRRRTCEHCRADFFMSHRKRNVGRFCSRLCAFAWLALRRQRRIETIAARPKIRPVQSAKSCRECSASFVPSKSASQALCSDACRRRRACRAQVHRYQAKAVLLSAACRQCAQPFATTNGERIYCSRACARRAARKGKAKNSETRTRRKGGTVDYGLAWRKVCARDGWRCQLCGIRTPERLRGTYDDRAPELDHIVPIALGGSHTYVNVQCACRRCNLKKGSKPLGQLRLAV